MLMNASENDKLFAKEVPVKIKNEYTNQTNKGRLFVTIEWKETLMYSEKVLKITLTNEEDIYFLCNLELTEEDYEKSIASQNLMADFASFPQYFIQHVEDCFRDERNPNPSNYLAFTYSDYAPCSNAQPQLEIIKYLGQHKICIILKFIVVTDVALRQYQNALVKYIKEENRKLQNNLHYMEKDLKGKLATCQETLNSKIMEIEHVRKDLNKQLSEKDRDHRRELQEEIEKLNNKHKIDKDRLEKELKMNEYNFRKERQQFESRVNVLETLNKELQDKIYKQDSTIRELESTVRSLEVDVKHLNDNLRGCKEKYNRLLSDFQQKQFEMESLDGTLRELQQKLSSKEHSILKLKDRLENEIEQKKSFENKFDDVNFQLDMTEKMRKALEADKDQLNDVIISLQDKIKELKNEEKSLNHAVAKHKKIIEEKERALLDAKKEIADLNIALQSKIAEIKNFIDSNRNLLAKIEELKKELKDSENMRKFMHRQMTEQGVIPTYTPPPHLVSPTTVAKEELAKINSQRPKNSPPALTGKSASSKSVRIEEASPVYKQRSSYPPPSQRTAGTDSAYGTASLQSIQNTPEILAGNYKMNCNPPNLEEIDSEVINGAFGDHSLKHSTAKKTAKPSKPVNSSTPKSLKKR